MTAALRGDFYEIIGRNKNFDEIARGKLRSFLVANMTLNVGEEIPSSMDQRSIALYVSVKGLSAKAIHQELIQTLGAEAVVYWTVVWHLLAAKFPGQSNDAPDEVGVTRTDSVNAAILKALTDNSFSSVRELSRLICLSTATVHRGLAESLGVTIRHLHWIPNRMSDDQKTISVNMSRELLPV
jgi:hypothetical protein